MPARHPEPKKTTSSIKGRATKGDAHRGYFTITCFPILIPAFRKIGHPAACETNTLSSVRLWKTHFDAPKMRCDTERHCHARPDCRTSRADFSLTDRRTRPVMRNNVIFAARVPAGYRSITGSAQMSIEIPLRAMKKRASEDVFGDYVWVMACGVV